MKLSCVTASYVADLLSYPGQIDWSVATEAIVSGNLLENVDSMLNRLSAAELDGIEFWFPHVWPANITPRLASAIRKRLAVRGLVCCACAGSVGDPADDPYGCEELFQTARLLNAPLIAGHTQQRAVSRLGNLCSRYGIHLAYENGLEKSATQILTAIDGGGEWIGANLDTGNMAAQGGDPVHAVRELGQKIAHIHLKDVPAVGSHACVALGTGIVDVEGVIHELRRCGYDGWLSIEIETTDHDPTDEIVSSARTVRQLLQQGNES